MRLFGLVVAALVCAGLVVGGCGGGGGGGFPGTLSFTVEWNGQTTANSVKVTVNRNGTAVGTVVIPRSHPASSDTGEITNLTPGSYEIVAGASTSNDGSGAPFSTVQLTQGITAGVPTPVVSIFGATPASASLTPTAATINANQHVQLDATVYDSFHSAIYTAPGDWTWHSDNPTVADLDPSVVGQVDGYAEGTAHVTATHTASALSATSTITVQPGAGTKTKWTILVFLNAANDLDPDSDLNVNQMETGDTDSQVRIVLQWKRIHANDPWTGTRRYLVAHDNDPNTISSTVVQNLGNNIDMGDWHTLRDFVDWGMTNYPADRTVLVMWNHGSGWRSRAQGGGSRGVSFDDQTGNHIDTWQLAQAISHTPKIDIVAWDASLMQMIEIAYEIKDVTNYVVGSEESPPAAGYPYDAITAGLCANDTMAPKDFTSIIVTEMVKAYGSGSNVTQSSLDTSKLGDLATAVSSFADVMIHYVTYGGAQERLFCQNARLSAEHYEYYNEYCDLYDSVAQLMTKTGNSQVATAGNAVQQAINQAVLFEAHGSLHPHSHGVSIDYDSATNFQTDAAAYALLRFARETHWDEWLTNSP